MISYFCIPKRPVAHHGWASKKILDLSLSKTLTEQFKSMKFKTLVLCAKFLQFLLYIAEVLKQEWEIYLRELKKIL